MRQIDCQTACKTFQIWGGSSVIQVAGDLGIGKLTLGKWVVRYRETELLSGPHDDIQMETVFKTIKSDLVWRTRFLTRGATARRGLGKHPHRGFETVTIVYQGEVAHRDSTGGGGVIGPGDVQWMTAGAGILHEEFHSATFAARGGELEMVQLWVNLPAKNKMTAPGYQGILDRDIPVVSLADAAGQVRVIAGHYAGQAGPAHTFSPINVWDVRLHGGKRAAFSLPAGQALAVVVLQGGVQVNDQGQIVSTAQFVVFDQAGSDFSLTANRCTNPSKVTAPL